MLGADVMVRERVSLHRRIAQHRFRISAERYLDRRVELVARRRTAKNLCMDAIERRARPGQDASGHTFSFAHQPEQQVHGLDREMPHLAALVARKEQHATCAFGVALEHEFKTLTQASGCAECDRFVNVTHFSISVHIKATPDRVWAVMLDIERWPEWTKS